MRSVSAAAKMAAVEPKLQDLPSDPLLHILSFLSFRDLVSVSAVCRRLNELSKHNPLWKNLSQRHWLLSESERGHALSWYSLFVQTFSDLGRYVDIYLSLRQTWDQLTTFLRQHCPRIVASLKDGATEAELDAVEAQLGLKLPNDYRCSCRIHNGQKLVIPGLMGSMSLSNHYRSEVLLDVETAAGGFQTRPGKKNCIPVTFCFHTGLMQYLALKEGEGRERGELFYPSPNQRSSDPADVDMFITGSSFSSWFSSHVQNVVSGDFPIVRDQIFRYVHERGCVATTDDITVSVSTSFLPELSSVHPPHFFFTYKIRIEMSPEAPPSAACQLDSRYWKITTSDGNVEEVQGPGVVGEFPVMTPGKVHEYSSCTTFSTPSEFMEGHYTFHRLENKEQIFQVSIPRFHMECPPFRRPPTNQKSSRSRRLSDGSDQDQDQDQNQDQDQSESWSVQQHNLCNI